VTKGRQFGRVYSQPIFNGVLAELPAAAAKVWFALSAHVNGRAEATVSYARLARLTGLTVRGTKGAVAILKAAGVVSIDSGCGRKRPNSYTLKNDATREGVKVVVEALRKKDRERRQAQNGEGADTINGEGADTIKRAEMVKGACTEMVKGACTSNRKAAEQSSASHDAGRKQRAAPGEKPRFSVTAEASKKGAGGRLVADWARRFRDRHGQSLPNARHGRVGGTMKTLLADFPESYVAEQIRLWWAMDGRKSYGIDRFEAKVLDLDDLAHPERSPPGRAGRQRAVVPPAIVCEIPAENDYSRWKPDE